MIQSSYPNTAQPPLGFFSISPHHTLTKVKKRPVLTEMSRRRRDGKIRQLRFKKSRTNSPWEENREQFGTR
jgi:hypothetical protein